MAQTFQRCETGFHEESLVVRHLVAALRSNTLAAKHTRCNCTFLSQSDCDVCAQGCSLPGQDLRTDTPLASDTESMQTFLPRSERKDTYVQRTRRKRIRTGSGSQGEALCWCKAWTCITFNPGPQLPRSLAARCQCEDLRLQDTRRLKPVIHGGPPAVSGADHHQHLPVRHSEQPSNMGQSRFRG